MEIKLTPEESEDIFYDALCNAVGSGWISSYGLEMGYNQEDYDAAKAKLGNTPCYEDVLMQILRDGNVLKIYDLEGQGAFDATITMKDVHEKVCQTPLYHLQDMINETGDVVTADVVIQQVFYNEIIFG